MSFVNHDLLIIKVKNTRKDSTHTIQPYDWSKKGCVSHAPSISQSGREKRRCAVNGRPWLADGTQRWENIVLISSHDKNSMRHCQLFQLQTMLEALVEQPSYWKVLNLFYCSFQTVIVERHKMKNYVFLLCFQTVIKFRKGVSKMIKCGLFCVKCSLSKYVFFFLLRA